MLAIAFRFPAGHYHATPWRRHVNEADVEWPPAPWRILRALIATWHRKVDTERYPEYLLEAVIEKLACELPVYRLPPAIRAHSRHYMPVRAGKTDKPVLLLDAFARVDPDEELVAVWHAAQLSSQERNLLEVLVALLSFLGRAESWVDARVAPEWEGKPNCVPSQLAVGPETGKTMEPVRLIAPIPPREYVTWRTQAIQEYGLDVKKLSKAQRDILKTLPERFIDTLRLDTGDLHKAGWSSPPGARLVTYRRPDTCFTPRPRYRMPSKTEECSVTTARLALAGRPLPRLEDAVRIGELTRVAVMSKAKQLLGESGIPRVLSGHNLSDASCHSHAFYLPEDADADGYIDHVLIHAPASLPSSALVALDRIFRLWSGNTGDWKVIMEGYGSREDFPSSTYLGKSREWISVTPYLHPWHAKKRFWIPEQIARECRERGLPEPRVFRQPTIRIRGRNRRPLHFRRFRSRQGLIQPDTRGSFCMLIFPEPVAGPLALGFGCHYGLGIFRPINPLN